MNDTDTLNMLNISYDLIEQGELILSWLNQKRVKNWSEKKDTKRKTKQTNKKKQTNKQTKTTKKNKDRIHGLASARGRKNPSVLGLEQTNYICFLPARTVINTLTPRAEAPFVSQASSHRENVASVRGPKKKGFINGHFCPSVHATSADFSRNIMSPSSLYAEVGLGAM